jgi:Ca2+-transporting ATPase
VLLFWTLRGGWLDALLAGITLAMGILPQEFPVIMIVFLALGARRLAAQQVLTRRLNAIETLGADHRAVCRQDRHTDAEPHGRRDAGQGRRTGPSDLRAGRPSARAFHALLELRCWPAKLEPHDPMEQAFHRLAGRSAGRHRAPASPVGAGARIRTLARTAGHEPPVAGTLSNAVVVSTKGAPEAVADCATCRTPVANAGGSQAARLADRGLRVLGVAKAPRTGRSGLAHRRAA